MSAAKGRVDAAAAGVRSAQSAFLPQISANTIATSGSYRSILDCSPGVTPPYWLTVPSGGFLDQNLTLMAPLFTGGRLQSGVAAAKWNRRAAEGALAELRGEVTLEVQDAYLRVLVARQMVDVQEAKVAAATELLRTTTAQLEAGKGIEASTERVQAELSHAKRSLTSSRNDAAKAFLDLDAVIGLDFGSSITLADALSLSPVRGKLDDYLAIAKSARGQMLVARAMAEAAKADVRSTRAEGSPQIFGQAMTDLASPGTGSGGTLGLTLSIPIFDGGRIRADVAAARSAQDQAEANVASVAIAVESEVRKAWLDVETAQANADSAAASVKAAQSAYDVIALRVGAGKSILVEQLDALEALTEAKADLAQALYEHGIAIDRLVRAAGGSK